MGATQRPAAVSSLFTPSGPPAWEDIPSWYLVARQDRTIPPEAERAMAARAGSTTVEIDSSHVAMMSHPSAVVSLITAAAAADQGVSAGAAAATCRDRTGPMSAPWA